MDSLLTEELLRTFVGGKHLTRMAHRLARKRGYFTAFSNADFGRTAVYYKPIHNLFLKWIGSPRGKKVLQLASSTGIYTKLLQDEGAIAVSFERSQSAVEIANELGNKASIFGSAKIDLTSHLPFQDEAFDVFISDHFLFSEFRAIDDVSVRLVTDSSSLATLQELCRILKPGGTGILFRVSVLGKSTAAQIGEIGFEIIDSHFMQTRNHLSRFLIKYLALKKYMVLRKK